MFGRATIRLGIGPHSSLFLYLIYILRNVYHFIVYLTQMTENITDYKTLKFSLKHHAQSFLCVKRHYCNVLLRMHMLSNSKL